MEKQSGPIIDPLQEASNPVLNHEDSGSTGVDVVKRSSIIKTEMSNNQTSNYTLNKYKSIFGSNISYLKEWEVLCTCRDINVFRYWAFEGALQASRFRSVCWRVCLHIFNTDSSQWLSILRGKREKYEMTRHELMVTPGSANGDALDPNVNNPLSQDEQSPWNQYFEDSELKNLIRLDVKRTFPEVSFFQTPRIQEMLVSVLFCYARKHPRIMYMQGMHEILAPLTYVLNCDLVEHSKAAHKDHTPNLLQEIMDESYLEHDSFAIFEIVMSNMYEWYEDGDPKHHNRLTKPVKLLSTQPFARPQDIGPATKITQKLTRIHDLHLKRYEPEVFTHLDRLEIPPQIYGIRWVRLMFGREFTFSEVLLIWDAIFADPSPKFILIEFIMVAMISFIKDQLLEGDYISTMKLLMKYPFPSEAQAVIQRALSFRSYKSSSHVGKSVSFVVNAEEHYIQRVLQAHQSPPAHGAVTRSTSLPRPQSFPSSSLKQRSTSVDNKCSSQSTVSPTVHATQSLSGVCYSASLPPSLHDESMVGSETGSSSTTTTARMVSGLARLGERLGRPNRENAMPDKFVARPMDEFKFMARSAPIPTRGGLGGGAPTHGQAGQGSCTSSSEGEDDPSFPQKSNLTTPRVSVEDLLGVTMGCALRLTNHHQSLANRLAHLGIQSDFSIREAMEGMEETIEILKNLKGNTRRNSGGPKKKALPGAPQPNPTATDAEESPPPHTEFTHPLMLSETSTSDS